MSHVLAKRVAYTLLSFDGFGISFLRNRNSLLLSLLQAFFIQSPDALFRPIYYDG